MVHHDHWSYLFLFGFTEEKIDLDHMKVGSLFISVWSTEICKKKDYLDHLEVQKILPYCYSFQFGSTKICKKKDNLDNSKVQKIYRIAIHFSLDLRKYAEDLTGSHWRNNNTTGTYISNVKIHANCAWYTSTYRYTTDISNVTIHANCA